jgi:thiosulfate/3-mercaptopyruvate sulfurtransferase
MQPEPDLGPPFVGADWLADRLGTVLVADVRWYLDGRSGRAAYDDGHLPGAIFVDLDVALADPPSPGRGRHPLPDERRFAAELGALGVGDDVHVVAYDDAGTPGSSTGAARLVWLLRRIGQPASVLDGGIGAWPGPLETAASHRPAVVRSVRAWPSRLIADADETAVAPVVLDARAAPRYRGELEPVDPRAGHIPGARSVPYDTNLDADQRLLSPAGLRERLAEAGVSPGGEPPVVYCGSGVTACHVLLALEAAELGPGRLYAGSWSQWSSDPARPAAVGPEPHGSSR